MIQVLVCDDDPSIRHLLTVMLEQMGMTVIEASDGEQALRLLGEHRPDVMISDVDMPHLRGTDLFLAVKQDGALASTPIILMSVFWLEEIRSVGAPLFLRKPFTFNEVREIIRRALESQ